MLLTKTKVHCKIIIRQNNLYHHQYLSFESRIRNIQLFHTEGDFFTYISIWMQQMNTSRNINKKKKIGYHNNNNMIGRLFSHIHLFLALKILSGCSDCYLAVLMVEDVILVMVFHFVSTRPLFALFHVIFVTGSGFKTNIYPTATLIHWTCARQCTWWQ